MGSPGDRAVAEIAESQYGVINRRQLLTLGLGPGAIAHRLATGRLHRLHRGVYAVHAHMTGRGRWMAAVLAYGKGAVLSHRSGAALWSLTTATASRVDVTATGRSGRGQPGIVLHRVRSLHSEDRVVRDGIPVTGLARTLLDLAEVVGRRQLERAFEEAERVAAARHCCDLAALQTKPWTARTESAPRGPCRSRRPLPETRSELERSFADLCRKAGLPAPAFNVSVAGFEPDAVWPDRRLVVELDGYAFHRTRAAFERDRSRDAELQLAEYRVVRVTARRLADHSAGVVETLRLLLGSGSGRRPDDNLIV